MQEWGISTVIINRRHGACGRCADFVGMVFIDDVYAGGKPSDHGGKYPLLSDAMKSGLFHPRCKDSSSLYIEGISTPPDREVLPKKAQEDLTEIERAEQKAAYGKRMEKMNKRLSKYALDPDNKRMYRGRAEQWSEYTEKWQSYHEKQLAKAEKSGIIIVHSFHADSDPMFEVTGSAFDSNPKEIQDIVRQLNDWGVSINYTANSLSYGCTKIGVPGTMSVTKNASYSAWLHEFQHVKDDKEAGWDGLYVLWNDPAERERRERRAYNVEINIAKTLKRDDVVKRLEANLNAEIKRIWNDYNKYQKYL